MDIYKDNYNREYDKNDIRMAMRISRAIQEYLEEINRDGLNSVDVFDRLVRKNVIEDDRHQGYYFRRFLKFLLDHDLLRQTIPQCSWQVKPNSDQLEWRFYRVKSDKGTTTVRASKDDAPRIVHMPQITDKQIEELFKEYSSRVEALPKKDVKDFKPYELEARRNSPRAYEIWTVDEIELIKDVYFKFDKKIDQIARLLKRQERVVRKRIMQMEKSGVFDE